VQVLTMSGLLPDVREVTAITVCSRALS